MLRHAFPVMGRGQQTLHDTGKGSGIRTQVLHERLHLLRFRWQADEIKRRASKQRHAVRSRSRHQSTRHLSMEKRIDRIAV